MGSLSVLCSFFSIFVLVGFLVDFGGSVNPPFPAPKFEIDLDKSPSERWKEVILNYKEAAPFVMNYFDKMTTRAERDILEFIAGHLDEYLGELGQEMKSIAEYFGVPLGIVVTMNFIYDFRHLGPPDPNRTIDMNWCTSVVAENSTNTVFHGRNMDWNLPDPVRNLTFICDWKKNGEIVFSGACIAGFVGMLTGFKTNGYGLSINARDLGGNVLEDFLEGFLLGAWDPTHLARRGMTICDTFDDIVELVSTKRIMAPCYFIISGVGENSGCVVTRDRNSVRDTWNLEAPTRWWLLETNYDHWEPPPKHDDRRNPGNAHIRSLGRDGAASMEGMAKVMTMWPTCDGLTAYSTYMCPQTGEFQVFIRFNSTYSCNGTKPFNIQ